MGIFYEMAQVVNVAPVTINVRFDGQDMKLAPGGPYSIPRVAVANGKNQNPIMGSQDPSNPHMSGARYLLREVGVDDCEPMTQEEWQEHLNRPMRMDEVALFEELYGGDPKARMVLQGKKGSPAKSRYDAAPGSNQNDNSQFDGHA